MRVMDSKYVRKKKNIPAGRECQKAGRRQPYQRGASVKGDRAGTAFLRNSDKKTLPAVKFL